MCWCAHNSYRSLSHLLLLLPLLLLLFSIRWERWTLDDDHNHALDVFACLRNVSNDAEKQLSHMPSSFQEDIDTETEVKLGRNFATIF